VISKSFPGRTGDMIKNRFYSCLKKRVHLYDVQKIKRLKKKYNYRNKKQIKSNLEEHCHIQEDYLKKRLNAVEENTFNNSAFKPVSRNSMDTTSSDIIIPTPKSSCNFPPAMFSSFPINPNQVPTHPNPTNILMRGLYPENLVNNYDLAQNVNKILLFQQMLIKQTQVTSHEQE